MRIQSEQRGKLDSEKKGKEEVVTGNETDRMRRQDRERRRRREGSRGVDRDGERDADSMYLESRGQRRNRNALFIKDLQFVELFPAQVETETGCLPERKQDWVCTNQKKIWNQSNLGLVPYSLISLNIIEPVEG